MFAIAFIYGFFQIKDWKKKKRLEKQSDIAEKVLHYLDNSEIDFRELVEFKSNSFHIYDRNSKGNKDKMASLSPEKQEQFRKRLDQDPEELRNYIKSLRNVSMVLRKAHLISLRLSSDKAQKILSELMESLKQLIREIILYRNPKLEPKDRSDDNKMNTLEEAIKKLYDVVRKELKTHLCFL